ncbi:MAG: NAD(P)-dependent alcohol dehydrogenase [Longimicrobiales bacterium]|nr:NAD(P)-dependent alcohol dehydrogenase [Longimicrobiales bacterium]
MRSAVYRRYGPPSGLTLQELPEPTPERGEVLVRVHATSINAGDLHMLRGRPLVVRPYAGGLLKPTIGVLGSDVAGVVEAVGDDVEAFRLGDRVMGDLSESGFGGFAELAVAPPNVLANIPVGVSFREAAALPSAGTTALQGLRDHGELSSGQHVLVNGASGGVGSFAVQIAKSMGAEVTGVCSARKMDLVRNLGADHVVDYGREDFTTHEGRYDLILDTAAYRPIWVMRRPLRPRGRYIAVGGAFGRTMLAIALGPLLSSKSGRTLRFMGVKKPSGEDLAHLAALTDQGSLTPAVDRTFPLECVVEAMEHLEREHGQGKIILSVAPV